MATEKDPYEHARQNAEGAMAATWIMIGYRRRRPINLPEGLWAALAVQAAREHRSVNSVVQLACEERIAKEDPK